MTVANSCESSPSADSAILSIALIGVSPAAMARVSISTIAGNSASILWRRFFTWPVSSLSIKTKSTSEVNEAKKTAVKIEWFEMSNSAITSVALAAQKPN